MYAANIEVAVRRNTAYRRVVFTDDDQQLVLMSLATGEDIPIETHDGTQLFRIESGSGSATVGKKKMKLKNGVLLIVPPNTKHYIKNSSRQTPLKLYSVYSPPQHPPSTVHQRQPHD